MVLSLLPHCKCGITLQSRPMAVRAEFSKGLLKEFKRLRCLYPWLLLPLLLQIVLVHASSDSPQLGVRLQTHVLFWSICAAWRGYAPIPHPSASPLSCSLVSFHESAGPLQIFQLPSKSHCYQQWPLKAGSQNRKWGILSLKGKNNIFPFLIKENKWKRWNVFFSAQRPRWKVDFSFSWKPCSFLHFLYSRKNSMVNVCRISDLLWVMLQGNRPLPQRMHGIPRDECLCIASPLSPTPVCIP